MTREQRMDNETEKDGDSDTWCKKTARAYAKLKRMFDDWVKGRRLRGRDGNYGKGGIDEYFRVEYARDWRRQHYMGRSSVENIFTRRGY